MLPDFGTLWAWIKKDWKVYKYLHFETGKLYYYAIGALIFCRIFVPSWGVFLIFGILMYAVHVLIDRFWHDKETGEYIENAWLYEIAVWVGLILWGIAVL